MTLQKVIKNEVCEISENPIKMRLLKIINNASENELLFYLGLIEQAQKSLKYLD